MYLTNKRRPAAFLKKVKLNLKKSNFKSARITTGDATADGTFGGYIPIAPSSIAGPIASSSHLLNGSVSG